jgi:pimeloyl-ACP methyl ester carboxylesterase
LKKLTIPKYFYIGTKDVIADENDLQRTLPLFDQHLEIEMIKDYAHLDYVWATDAHIKLYPQILKNIAEQQLK